MKIFGVGLSRTRVRPCWAHQKKAAYCGHKNYAVSSTSTFCICNSNGDILFAQKQFRTIVDHEWSKKNYLPTFAYVEYKNAKDKLLYSGKNIELRISAAGPVFLCRAEQIPSTKLSRLDLLTEQERNIAEYFQQGCSYKEIADKLNISPKTVDNHAQNIRRKLNIRTMKHLTRFYTE